MSLGNTDKNKPGHSFWQSRPSHKGHAKADCCPKRGSTGESDDWRWPGSCRLRLWCPRLQHLSPPTDIYSHWKHCRPSLKRKATRHLRQARSPFCLTKFTGSLSNRDRDCQEHHRQPTTPNQWSGSVLSSLLARAFHERQHVPRSKALHNTAKQR